MTGLQRGPTELGTDDFTNIRQLIIAASDIHTNGIDTMVQFNERIFSARYAKKYIRIIQVLLTLLVMVI